MNIYVDVEFFGAFKAFVIIVIGLTNKNQIIPPYKTGLVFLIFSKFKKQAGAELCQAQVKLC